MNSDFKRQRKMMKYFSRQIPDGIAQSRFYSTVNDILHTTYYGKGKYQLFFNILSEYGLTNIDDTKTVWYYIDEKTDERAAHISFINDEWLNNPTVHAIRCCISTYGYFLIVINEAEHIKLEYVNGTIATNSYDFRTKDIVDSYIKYTSAVMNPNLLREKVSELSDILLVRETRITELEEKHSILQETIDAQDINLKKSVSKTAEVKHEKNIQWLEFTQKIEDKDREIALLRKKIDSIKPPITCMGCLENQPNQMAHMDYGGCLYCDC